MLALGHLLQLDSNKEVNFNLSNSVSVQVTHMVLQTIEILLVDSNELTEEQKGEMQNLIDFTERTVLSNKPQLDKLSVHDKKPPRIK